MARDQRTVIKNWMARDRCPGWLVERPSGVGWLAIRGAFIISWMARDRRPGWLVERSSSVVGWLVKSRIVS